MENKTYGYVRVSTKEQNENRQLDAMLKFGVAMEDITVEKISGKDFKRPLYTALVTRLQEGDVLVVESLDRFGRNYIEIQNQWQLLTNEKGVSIVVLDLDILDTRQTGDEMQDLTSRLISDVALRLFSYVAELECRHIRQRQAEGIQAARERGVHMGRKPLKMTDGFPDLVKKWHKGEISAREAANQLGISRNTFLKYARKTSADETIVCQQ